MAKLKIAVVSTSQPTLSGIKQVLATFTDLLLLNDSPIRLEQIDQISVLQPNVMLIGVDRGSVHAMRHAVEEARRRAPRMGIVAVLEEADFEIAQEALSAGAKNVVLLPLRREQVINMIIEAYGSAEQAADIESMRTAKGKVITVYGTKGGCGKTTIAANLSTALAQVTHRRVAAVDLDLEFGDLAVLLQQERRGHHSIYDVLEGTEINADKMLASLAMSDSGRVSFLPSLSDPAQLSSISPSHVKHLLETLRSEFDYVVIDSHQSLDSDRTLEALDIADVLFVVTAPDIPTLLKTGRAFETLEKLGYADSKIKLVANRSNTGNIKYVEEYFGRRVDFRIPSNGLVAVQAANKGVPFAESPKNSDIKKAIFEMARAVAVPAQMSDKLLHAPEPERNDGRPLLRVVRKGA